MSDVDINIKAIYPLTPMQHGMLFHAVRHPDSRAYFEQVRFQLEGRVDRDLVERAFRAVVDRHDALRTLFLHEDLEHAYQIVLAELDFRIEHVDLSALPADEHAAACDSFADADRRKGFDLAKDPPMRVALVTLADDRHLLLWSIHHIVIDGWSAALVFQEFGAAYAALQAGGTPALDPPVPYQSYVEWVQHRDHSTSMAWWRDLLSGYDEAAGLPRARDNQSEHAYRDHHVSLDAQTTTALASLARSERVTMSSVVQALWAILLARYTDREDVVFGTVVSNRPPEVRGIERLVGLCINTIPVRARPGADRTLGSLLADLHAQYVSGQTHHASALVDVQATSPLRQDLFDHLVVFENYPMQAAAGPGSPSLGFSVTDASLREHTSYGFNVIVRPGAQLALQFSYDANVYSPGLVARIAAQFATLAGRAAASHADTRVGTLEILSAADRRELLVAVNDTAAEYPRDATILALIDAHTSARPDATALIAGDRTWSYKSLDRWAGAIKAALAASGVERGDRVAIAATASPSIVASILGVLKAGAAYVPISPDAPESRRAYIIADSGSRLVIDDAWLNKRGLSDAPRIAMPSPAETSAPDDVAYVIYTSGSTGQPKGCAVTHRNVVRLMVNSRFPFRFGHDDVWIVAHAFSFDFSVWEMYGALVYGGALVLPSREQRRNSVELLALVRRHRVTVLNQTPGAFDAFVEAERAPSTGSGPGEPSRLDEHLRYVIFGGDRLEPARLRPWADRYPLSGIALINMYGITETTVHVTVHRVTPDDLDSPGVSPIGRPLPETTVYLLDRRLQPVPLGAPGEMYVGGTGVSAGYLQQPELTAARFLSDPVRTGGRMYRSGDVAWRRDDGTLAFVGRADQQLKIRGFRVEPGEIEHALRSRPGVQAAVVVGHRDAVGATSLVAYVVVDTPDVVDSLRPALAETLPDYLVPSTVMSIPSIPLTVNGKIDRAALPVPGSVAESADSAAPRTSTETALAAIWQHVLGRSTASLSDHFFDLGGHSLSAMRLVAQVRSAGLGALHMDDVFETPTLGELARRLDAIHTAAAGEPAAAVIARQPDRERYALSPAQRRLWIIEQLDDAKGAYDVSSEFRVEGELNVDALRAALGDLLDRHEILRTAIVVENGVPAQVIAKSVDVPLFVGPPEGGHHDSMLSWRPALAGPGTSAPLWRVHVYRAGDETRLSIVVHHLLVDAWSLGLLVKELAEAYAARLEGRAPAWTPLPIQYRDVAAWQLEQIATGALEPARQYWRSVLASPLPVIDLPGDAARPSVKSYDGASVRHTVSRELTDALLALGRARDATPFMTLVALVSVLLARITGQDELIVATPIATRTRPELAGQVGLYLNTLPLRLRVRGDATADALLAHVRDVVTGALAHADYPFDALVDDLQLPRDLSRMPLTDVLIVVQQAGDASPTLAGAQLTPVAAPVTTSKFDLTVFLTHGPDGVEIGLEYATALFTRDRMTRLCAQLEVLASSFVAAPSRPVAELDALPASERVAVIKTFNTTAAPESGRALDQLLSESAIRHGEEPALVFEGHTLSYAALFARARQVARHLRAQGVGRDDLVALIAPRSPELVINLLGIVAAGAAVLPIDVDTPDERRRQILEASGARLTLTRPPEGGHYDPEESWRPDSAGPSEGPPEGGRYDRPPVQPADLLYVIYTSGSTGTPKGVMVEHRTMVNLIEHQLADPSLAFRSVLQFAPIGFDVSLQEIFTTLAAGGTLHLIEPGLRTRVRDLWDHVERHHIETLFLPTAYLRMLMSDPDLFDALPACVTQIITAGEQLLLPAAARSTLSRVTLHNHYGPAETHVATTWTLRPGASPPPVPPIGRPIRNTRVYILDQHNQPAGIGVPGELYIAGAAVGRGYLGQPDATRDRFSPDPFADGRMYRTGDRARWREDGELEFLGRLDDQIKIRGFRVEPGEIESVLLSHPAVRQAAVLPRHTPAGRELVAYIAGDPGLSAEPVRAWLLGRLPDYLVPSWFVCLDALPLSAHGKVDRGALPAPEAVDASARREYRAPDTDAQRDLVAILEDVLRRPVGLSDNFFQLGGDSLKAIQVISRIHRDMGVDASVRALFSHTTIEALADSLATPGDRPAEAGRHARGGGRYGAAIERIPDAPHYTLSPGQRRLWLLSQIDEASTAYHIPLALELTGPLDATAWREAVHRLVRRHEILRTTIELAGDEPRQRVHDAGAFLERHAELTRVVDLRAEPDPVAAAESLARAEAHRPFDLAAGPLLRAVLLTLAPDRHVLLFTLHHIVSDGWSLRVLAREFAEHYTRLAAHDHTRDVDAPAIQYRDYAAWHDTLLGDPSVDAHRTYWHQQLALPLPVLDLPADFSRPRVQTFAGRYHSTTFSRAEAAALSSLAQRHGATLFALVTTLVNVLLHRYTNAEDIVVGSPIAGRGHVTIEDQIGFYVNTLAVRTRLHGDEPFAAVLARVQSTIADAMDHQVYPFDRLVEELGVPRDLARQPVFDVMVLLDRADAATLPIPGVSVSAFPASGRLYDVSKFDLTFGFTDSAEGLALGIEYNAALFADGRIARMARHFGELAREVLADDSRAIGALNLLPADERARVLIEFNTTSTDYPRESTIVELFEAQAAARAGEPAVIAGGETFSYGRLNECANAFADRLRREHHVEPNDIVAIAGDRDAGTVIGMLGALKAGAAYLPIDPRLPRPRVDALVQDARVRTFIERDEVQSLTTHVGHVPNPPRVNGATDLAYVMYTSGSTGAPKGVMVEHRSVVRLVKNTWYFPFDDRQRILQTGAPMFDATTFEVWGALLNGGRLYLVDDAVILDAAALGQTIAGHGITALWLTSALFNYLCDENESLFAPLQTLLVGGDVLSPAHIHRVRRRHPHLTVINGYGPTENTTFSACAIVGDDSEHAIPIGRPISNSTAYVLDAQRRPLPIGVPGELCVGGDGVARGYLNQPDATRERFVEDLVAGGRMYRTGDRARWREDGQLEFLGRLDDQVKIRGFRVEPGEIETVLLSYPDVRQVAVVAIDANGARELAAYVAGTGASTDSLRAWLAERVPDYLVPRWFIRLERLPLSAHGKIDRRALPAPDDGAEEPRASYRPPANRVERQVVAVLEEVLGTRVGLDDNFFHLGGDSLKAVRAASRIHRDLGVAVGLRDLFGSATIESLAASLGRRSLTAHQPIAHVPDAADYPLSPGQRRLWVLGQLDGAGAAYHIPLALLLTGPLNAAAWLDAVRALVRRHESLRTTITLAAGEPRQRVHDAGEFLARHPDIARVIDLRAEPDPDAAAERLARADARQPFDLSTGPLLRSTLLHLGDERHVMLVTLHHIVGDAWSLRVLAKEFARIYGGISLPPLGLQYRDYAVWHQRLLDEPAFNAHRDYWHAQLAGPLPVLELPLDFPRPRVQTFGGGYESIVFSREESDALNGLARRHGATLFAMVTAIVNAILHRQTGAEDILLGTPVAGRGHVDLEDQIGFYANTLVLRTAVQPDDPFTSLLARTQHAVAGATEHESYPFDRLVEELHVARDLGRQPIFDVMVLLDTVAADAWPMATPAAETFPRAGRIYNVSKFDLTFAFTETPAGLTLGLEYNASLFSGARAAQLAQQVLELVRSVLEDPAGRVGALNVFTPQERARLLVDFNDTAAPVPESRTVLDLFEDLARRAPNAVAVIAGAKRRTYGELDGLASRIAPHLTVSPDEPVGIVCASGDWSIAGILGILKAGAAFLPMDASWPVERMRRLVADSGCRFVLGASDAPLSLDLGPGVTMFDVAEAAQSASRGVRSVRSSPGALAYVIYTSGSTGQPKGVAIEHASLMNYVSWAAREYARAEPTHWPLFTSLAFDLTITSLFVPLTTGRAIVVYNGDAKDALDRILDDKLVSVIKLTPAHLRLIRARNNRGSSVRRLVVGGENLESQVCRDVLETFGGLVEICNEYGPTEATVGCMLHRFDAARDLRESVPLGRPAANTHIYLIDRAGHPVPGGACGEIWIGGAGLARGYLGQSEATGAKFGSFQDERVYRTGDVGRWLPDGTIEFVGRADGQVKIRGHRVEPGEIEQRLLTHPAIAHAAVVARKVRHDHLELAAYVVPRSGLTLPATADLRDFIGQALPPAMVPSYFVVLDDMPLTRHGKVDRAALPAPEAQPSRREEPASDLESALLSVWRETLKVDGMGVTDNFFELGGDSIKAIQMSSALHARHLQVTLTEILAFPTVRSLAPHVRSAETKAHAAATPGDVPLAPIQRWFFDWSSASPHHYNQAAMLTRAGGFDETAVHRALDALVAHHDALRIVFDGDRQIQQGEPAGRAVLVIQDLVGAADAAIPEAASHLHRSIDLRDGPLFKAGLFRVQGESHLLLVAHHLVVDGVSWRVLMEDFSTAYAQAASGADVQLPPRTTAFGEWCARTHEYAGSDRAALEVAYWTDVEHRLSASRLPREAGAPETPTVRDSRRASIVLDASALRDAHRAYGTDAQDLLLAAVGAAAAETWGRAQTGVLVEGHGREDLFDGVDVSRTVGWFTSMYPVVIESPPGLGAAEAVAGTKEMLRRVPRRGAGYGMLRYGSPAPERQTIGTAAPDIRFNYLGEVHDNPGQGAVQLSPYGTGEAISPDTPMEQPLDIAAIARGDQFVVGLTWHPAVLADRDVDRFRDALQQHLTRLIDHCRGIEQRVLTPSDVAAGEDLSIDELQNIQRSIQ